MTATPGVQPTLTPFNLAHEHRPDRTEAPRTPDEVAAVLRRAARDGDRVHVVGSGHGLGPVRGGVALSTAAFADVTVDPATATARVGAGARWGDVLRAAADHGLAPVTGSAPDVGVAGLLLGGGLGPIARTAGWSSDHVRSLEVVTGAGEVVTATPDDHGDLFWALRGGKHAPAVVTSVELDLLPLRHLWAGGLFFGAADAEAVLTGFAAWSADLPESVTASVALLRLPPTDAVPMPLRGRFVVHVRVAVVPATGVGAEENAAVGAALVAPLRALATPILDTLGTLPYAQLGSIHADPVEPMPVLDGGALLSGFDEEAARALLGAAGPDSDAPFAAVEVRVLGGALARAGDVPDAVVGRDASHHLFAVSLPLPELFTTAVPAAAMRLIEVTAPWSLGRSQPNFIGGLNPPTAWDRAWPATQRRRLDEVRAAHDPGHVLTAHA